MLILLDRVRERAGIEEGPTLPHCDLVVHGGIAWPPYRQGFARHVDDLDRKSREVYPASEGFVAVADRGPGEGMRLMLDNGLFFEFVPVEELGSDRPTRHWDRDDRGRRRLCRGGQLERRALGLSAGRHGALS